MSAEPERGRSYQAKGRGECFSEKEEMDSVNTQSKESVKEKVKAAETWRKKEESNEVGLQHEDTERSLRLCQGQGVTEIITK